MKIFDYIKQSDLEVGKMALEKELRSKKKAPSIFTLKKKFERNLRVEKIKRKSLITNDDYKARVEQGVEIFEKQINLVDIEKYKQKYYSTGIDLCRGSRFINFLVDGTTLISEFF